MPTRNSPPSTAAQELIAALTGYEPPTETREQTAGQELLAELFGIDVPNAAQRGEDFWTAHSERRRPADLPYNPINPQPGPFGQFPEMEWIQVDSTNVDKIAYDLPTSQLYVQFLDGSIYVYYDVPSTTWADFLASNSKGMFVWHVLRNNSRTGARFRYQNIRSGQRIIRSGPDKGKSRVTPIYTAAERAAGRR